MVYSKKLKLLHPEPDIYNSYSLRTYHKKRITKQTSSKSNNILLLKNRPEMKKSDLHKIQK